MAFGTKDTPAPPESRQTSAATIIARDTRFSGEVTGSKAMRVEGAVKGKIALKAALDVAQGAVVEAEVTATSVRVAGTVVGNITASEIVELLSSARVTGDVTAAALHVIEGATLEGRVHMRSEAVARQPEPAPEKAR